MSAVDLSGMSDRELRELQDAVSRERVLRRELGASPEKIDHAVREYQAAAGVVDGDPWKPPTSSLMRPMKGDRREHGGKMWRSTIDHNVFEPGVSGWKLEPEIDPETGEATYPPFVRPSGAHDAYEIGDRITGEDGNVYEANRDGVDWPPEVVPQDWDLVEPEPDPEPDPPEDEEPDPEEPTDPEEPEPGDGEGDEDDDPTEPEPEPEPDPEPEPPEEEEEPEPDEPALPEWKVGVEYQPGDRFTYNGSEYTVLQAHTSAAHWPPDAVASLYERQ